MGITIHDRLQTIWRNIQSWCNNENSISYDLYGKRGVKVCDEWVNDFQKFHDWAISNGYDKYLYIILIDINGNYEPSNCKIGNYEDFQEMFDKIVEEVESDVND